MDTYKITISKKKPRELGMTHGMLFGDWKFLGILGRYKSHDYALVSCKHRLAGVWLAVRHLKEGKSQGCRKCCATRQVKFNSKEELRIRDLQISIIQRCGNPDNCNYAQYGGRGIHLAEDLVDARSFIGYVTNLPFYNFKKGLELDRIDNDKGYEKGNLRWADRKIQNGNKRSSIIVEWDGIRMSMSEFSRRYTRVSESQAAQLYRRNKSLQEIIDYFPYRRKTIHEKRYNELLSLPECKTSAGGSPQGTGS